MATPIYVVQQDEASNLCAKDRDGEPSAKRQKIAACSRCRRRKQKCDGKRPCANCTLSSEQCNEALSAYARPPPALDTSIHTHPAWLGNIARLEERISKLEQTFRHPVNHPALVCNQEDRELHRIFYTGTEDSNTCSISFGRSSPAIGLLATFARSDDGLNTQDRAQASEGQELKLDSETEESLFDIYHDRVQYRYPFLQLDQLRDPRKRPAGKWVPYFTNMIFSVALLLNPDLYRPEQKLFYRKAVTGHLSYVFAQPDRLLHIQAYLLLAMHAIYSPSTERIISIASATMRYCVMAQLHLADAEPEARHVTEQVAIQMRRRIFWSAYALDRTVGTMFNIPFSIPDYQITVKMFCNIDDRELKSRCAEAFPQNPQSRPELTGVSAALHVVYCRQIQSEILNITLHRDFEKQFDCVPHWRYRVLRKLERWKSLCHRYSDTNSKNFTSSEWLHMIYNYSLAMLYEPTKTTVTGPAGDWTVKSCIQACLIFRKFQRDRPIAELWLGNIAQFKCGVALLYCFFACPPLQRTETYHLAEASEAVRACCVVLAILAERWPQSKCLSNAFDVLAREIPLFEPTIAQGNSAFTKPRKMRIESSEILINLLPDIEAAVVHRNTLRMIREMASEEFTRPAPSSVSDCATTSLQASQDAEVDHAATHAELGSPRGTAVIADIFQPIAPDFFVPGYPELTSDPGSFPYESIGFPGEFDEHFPV